MNATPYLTSRRNLGEVRLIPATLADYELVQNMARFYVYDVSRYCGFTSAEWSLPANGLYECFDLKKYFEEPTRKVFLIQIEKELAGFVLLNKAGLLSKIAWNIGEFFILAKFQNKGIGKAVVCQIWNLHPGAWEVSVLPENSNALSFWRKLISNFTAANYSEEVKSVDHDLHQPKRIVFNFEVPIRQSENSATPKERVKLITW